MKHQMKWDNLITSFLKLNSQLNLSAIRDPDGVYQKHILDSLELSKVFPLADNRKVCDIGT
jgi:16S rRNA G527 N7-methylase RsmG